MYLVISRGIIVAEGDSFVKSPAVWRHAAALWYTEIKIEKIFCFCQHLASLIRSIGEHSEEEVEAMTKRRDRTFRNSYEQLLYEMARAGRLDR